MPSFLTKVFGRKKEGASSPGSKSATGELLDGKFEDVSPTVSPAAAHFPELQTNGNPRGRGTDRTISESKLRTFFRSKSRSRAASPVHQQRKLEELPQLPLSLLANLNQDEAEVLLSDSVIGERKLTPVEAVGLVKVCSEAITNHGVDTLGIMNPHWYSASPEVQRRLISLFIQSLTSRSPLSALPSFDSEINSTKSPHDVAAVLRWGLRHLQLQGDAFGHKADWYQTFFDAERNSEYPPKAFTDKLEPLIPSEHMALLKEVLEVFSTLAAHGEGNSTSGSKLSKIFGLWLLNSHRVETTDDWKSFYDRWEIAGRQLEHIFFARIRDEAVEKRMPTRLVDLVRKYPFYKDNASPTTDQRLLPRSPLSTRVYDALLVRVDTEVPTDKSRPKYRVHPVRILAEALSSVAEEGELSGLWSTISEASKREGSGTPLSRILSDDTVRLLSLLPDDDALGEKSPASSLLPLSASSPRMKRNSFSLSEFTEELRRTHSTQSTVSPHSPISADWSLFSTTGFGASPTLTPLSSALFSPDLERTSPPSRRPSRHGKEGSAASTAPRKSVDFAPTAFPSTIAEEQRVDPTSKISSLQVVQLDESFIDFWSDALLDPVSSNWPSFVVCRLNSDVVPQLKYGPAEEGLPEKTLQWLVVEQQFTVKEPPASTPAPAPVTEETVQARPERPSSPQSLGKKRFSFWSSSRSISSTSITSTKSKRKDLLKGQRVGEMGEVLEEGEQSNGTRSRRRSKAEDVVRVRIPSPKPRKSGDVRSLQSVDVGSPAIVKKPVPALPKAEETKAEGESQDTGNAAAVASTTVAAAGAAVVAATAAPALAAAASVIAVPVAAVAAVAAVANATTEAEKEGEPESAERKEEEGQETKAAEDGTHALEEDSGEAKDEPVVVVLDDKVSLPEADEPKSVLPDEVVVIPATAIAETEPTATAEDSVEAKEVAKEVEEVLAEVQSPPDPDAVEEATIPVEQVAVPVIEDDAVVGSVPAVVEEVAEDVHADSIPVIAPAPEEEAKVEATEAATSAVPPTEVEIKSRGVEVTEEPTVLGVPVQDLESTPQEASGAGPHHVAPTSIAELGEETNQEHIHVKDEDGGGVANGHPADASEATPIPEAPIETTPSDEDTVEQSVVNEEIPDLTPEPEVTPVQEEDVATAEEAVVDVVEEEPAPVNTIIGNGSLKEELAHVEPEVPSVDETISSEPTTASLEIPVPDRLVHDVSTDTPDTTASSADDAQPEATDTILESHLNTEHGTAALGTGLEETGASTDKLEAETEAENPESSTLTPREPAAERGFADGEVLEFKDPSTVAEAGAQEELERELHATEATHASVEGAALSGESAVVPEGAHSDLEDTAQIVEAGAPSADVNLDEPSPIQREIVHDEEQPAIDPLDSSLTETIAEAAPSLFAEEMDEEDYVAEEVNVISSTPHIEPLKIDDEDTVSEGVDLPAVPLVDAEFTQPSDDSEHITVTFDERPEQDEQSEAVSLSETLESQHLPPSLEHALEVGSTPSVEALLDAVQSGESANEDDADAKRTSPSIDIALAETLAEADDLPTAIETAFETGLAEDPEALLNAVQATLSAKVFASGATSPIEEKKEDTVVPTALGVPQPDAESLESEAKEDSSDHRDEVVSEPLSTSPQEAASQHDGDADANIVTQVALTSGEDGQGDTPVEGAVGHPQEPLPDSEVVSQDPTIAPVDDSLEREPVEEQRGVDASAVTERGTPEISTSSEDAAVQDDGGDVAQDSPTEDPAAPIIEDTAGLVAPAVEESLAVEVPAVAAEADPIVEQEEEGVRDSAALAADDAVAVEELPAANEDTVENGLASPSGDHDAHLAKESSTVVEEDFPATQDDEPVVGDSESLKVEEQVGRGQPVSEHDIASEEQGSPVVEEDAPPIGDPPVAEESQTSVTVEEETSAAEEGEAVLADAETRAEKENPVVITPVVEGNPPNVVEPVAQDEERIEVEGRGPVTDGEDQPAAEDEVPVVTGVEGAQLGEGENRAVEQEDVAHAEEPVVGEEKLEQQQQDPLLVKEEAFGEGQAAIVEERSVDQEDFHAVEEHTPVVEEDEIAAKEAVSVATEEKLDAEEGDGPIVEEQSTSAPLEEEGHTIENDAPVVEKHSVAEDSPVIEEDAPVAVQERGTEEATPAAKEDTPVVDTEAPHTEESHVAKAEGTSAPAEVKEPVDGVPASGVVEPESSPAVAEAELAEAATASSNDAAQGEPAATPLIETATPAAVDKLSIPIVEDDDPMEEVDQPKPTTATVVEEATNTPNA